MRHTSLQGKKIRSSSGRRYLFSSKSIVNWDNKDRARRYVSDNPSASKFVSLMRQVDQGEIGIMTELADEMESKDLHLFGVANTRRLAITALDWNVVPREYPKDQTLADEGAAFCQEQLRDLDTFHDTLVHLQTSIFTNVAVTELVWDLRQEATQLLVKTNDVPGHKLRAQLQDSPDIRIVTEDDLYPGIPTPAGKFVVFIPQARAGFPFRITLARAQAIIYLIKHYGVADWSGFCEEYGMPIRTAQATDEIEPGVRSEVIDALKNMGSDAWAFFPQGVDIKMIESNRGVQPFQPLIKWCEEKQSIGALGQVLTTEATGVGSFALGRVHENVRADLLKSDLMNEARMIESGILAPMVALRFPGCDVPIPRFERVVHTPQDIELQRLRIEQLRTLREWGLEVAPEVIYEYMGIPQPQSEPLVEDSEEVLLLPEKENSPKFKFGEKKASSKFEFGGEKKGESDSNGNGMVKAVDRFRQSVKTTPRFGS